MGQILDAMTSFFDKDDWPCSAMKNQAFLQMAYAGDNGHLDCYAQAREEHQQFVFYSVVPVAVPEDKRPQMAEFVTRANYGLLVGNFELDFTDGEVRFKTSIDVENDRLSEALIRNAVHGNVRATDKYLPGIMALLYGGASPVDAVAKVEEA